MIRLRTASAAAMLLWLTQLSPSGYAGAQVPTQTLGCSVTNWTGIQQGLDTLFLWSCARHDQCYRTCNDPNGPYLQWGYKAVCDGAFLVDMIGACTVWSAVLDFPLAGWDNEQDFTNDCENVAYSFYVGVSVGGHNAFLGQQAPRCNQWAYGPPDSEFWDLCDCFCGGGGSTPIGGCILPPGCPGPGCPMTPILIDLQGNGLKLSGPNPPISFDFDADGIQDHTSWTRPQTKDGFLVIDRDRNGRIDTGKEMFGNMTAMLLDASTPENGFHPLAELDDPLLGGNNDGLISASDQAFSLLRVWIDKNRDTTSQSEELLTMTEAGVESISLGYRLNEHVDQWGNQFSWEADVVLVDGKSSLATDVVFARQD